MAIELRRRDLFLELPDAVLMDLDNTIYAYDPAHAVAQEAARRKTMRLLGVAETEFERAYQEAKRQVKDQLQQTASAHSRLLYFSRMLEHLGMKSQPLMALDLEQTYWRSFLSACTLFPGVKEFLEDLRVAGIPIAAVTDLTSQIQFRKLIYFGLDHHFDHIVTSEEAGIEKPSPIPFQIALERLAIATASRIWFVGDDPQKDIKGAKQAIDAIALQKRHAGVAVSAAADAVFDDFSELRGLLKRCRLSAQRSSLDTHPSSLASHSG